MDLRPLPAARHAVPRLPLRSELPRLVQESAAPTVGGAERFAFGDDGMTFGDLLDVINPLQHIPVVSTIYREMTDDDLANVPRILGDTLFGGLVSLAGAAVDVVVREFTGKDVGEHVVDLFTPEAPQPEFDARPVEQPAFATMMDAFDHEFLRGGDAVATASDPQVVVPGGEPATTPAAPARDAGAVLALGNALQAYRVSSTADALLDARFPETRR